MKKNHDLMRNLKSRFFSRTNAPVFFLFTFLTLRKVTPSRPARLPFSRISPAANFRPTVIGPTGADVFAVPVTAAPPGLTAKPDPLRSVSLRRRGFRFAAQNRARFASPPSVVAFSPPRTAVLPFPVTAAPIWQKPQPFGFAAQNPRAAFPVRSHFACGETAYCHAPPFGFAAQNRARHFAATLCGWLRGHATPHRCFAARHGLPFPAAMRPTFLPHGARAAPTAKPGPAPVRSHFACGETGLAGHLPVVCPRRRGGSNKTFGPCSRSVAFRLKLGYRSLPPQRVCYHFFLCPASAIPALPPFRLRTSSFSAHFSAQKCPCRAMLSHSSRRGRPFALFHRAGAAFGTLTAAAAPPPSWSRRPLHIPCPPF